MKISIITVCLNSQLTLERAFDSVLTQSFACYEFIVIDGCSSDNTIEIIKEYESTFVAAGIRFTWISERDDGIYDAMNKGIEMASGDLIGILNSDDFYDPGALEDIANLAKENPSAGIIYGFIRHLHEGKELVVQRHNYSYFLLRPEAGVQSAAQHPTCFVKKCIYDEIGKYDLQFRTAADYDFLLRAINAGVIFCASDKVITNFSLGGVSCKISDYELLEQRYRAQNLNGILSDSEYKSKMNYLKYTWCKEFKKKVVKWVFGG